MLKDSHNGAKDAEAQVGQHGDPRMLDAFVGIIVDRERRGFRLVFHLARSYTIPSFIRPASLIMFWFHGGSQTSWTSASSTPSIVRILLCASCAIAGPIPQPGAVSVIFTSTFTPPSGRFVSWQS